MSGSWQRTVDVPGNLWSLEGPLKLEILSTRQFPRYQPSVLLGLMQRINWGMRRGPHTSTVLFQVVQDGSHLERNTQQLYGSSVVFPTASHSAFSLLQPEICLSLSPRFSSLKDIAVQYFFVDIIFTSAVVQTTPLTSTKKLFAPSGFYPFLTNEDSFSCVSRQVTTSLGLTLHSESVPGGYITMLTQIFLTAFIIRLSKCHFCSSWAFLTFYQSQKNST